MLASGTLHAKGLLSLRGSRAGLLHGTSVPRLAGVAELVNEQNGVFFGTKEDQD